MLTARVFASGSSGNALLIRCNEQAILIDCGLSRRIIEQHLRYAGVTPGQLSAILLTHEHTDHSAGAGALARAHDIPIIGSNGTVEAIRNSLPQGTAYAAVRQGERASIGCFDVTSFSVPHDAVEPVGFRIQTEHGTIGIAIDLGCWDDSIASMLEATDLVVVEANHDRARLAVAPYPIEIIRRIASAKGHLDNAETGRLLTASATDDRPRTVWLAHLSENANEPKLAIARVRNELRRHGIHDWSVAVAPRNPAPGKRGGLLWSSTALITQTQFLLQ